MLFAELPLGRQASPRNHGDSQWLTYLLGICCARLPVSRPRFTGVEDPKTTASTYVVTPALVDAFNRALPIVGAALRDRQSEVAYLLGSFGSGKSHFMVLRSLLLAGPDPGTPAGISCSALWYGTCRSTRGDLVS